MDPLDDFQFKPLTEGLGFHKRKPQDSSSSDMALKAKGHEQKSTSKSQDVMKSNPLHFNFTDESAKSGSAKAEGLKLTTALPKKDEGKQKAKSSVPVTTPKKSEAVDDLVKSFRQPKTQFIEEKAQLPKAKNQNIDTNLNASTEMQVTAAQPWSVLAFMVDSMLIVALYIICLISTLLITEVDFVATLLNVKTDPQFFMTIPMVFIGMGLVYYLSTRAFLGATLGEMIFDLQVGSAREQKSEIFPLKIMARSLVNVATGIIILPLISIITRKDLAGKMTGTQLVAKEG